MAEEKDWWDGGGEGSDAGWDTDMEGESSNSKTAFMRHWMPSGTDDKKMLFLTAKSHFVYWEHNPKVGNSYRNFVTCSRMTGAPCPLCDAGIARYRASAFTVIDIDGYVDKKTNQRKENLIRLFIAKKGTVAKLAKQARRREDKDESLRGAVYLVSRSTEDQSASVGDDFEFQEMIDPTEFADLTGVCTDEMDYKELLLPDVEYATMLARRLAASGGTAAPGPKKKVNY